MSNESKLRKLLSKDKAWKRFLNIVDLTNVENMNDYIKDLETMHKTRLLRSVGLDNKVPTGKLLSKAAMQDQSYRSRCVEIVFQLLVRKNNLQRATTAIQKHILANYEEELKSMGSSVRNRQALVSLAVDSSSAKLQDMDSVIQMADLIIADIDKGSFAIKHAVDSLQVATRREFSV